MNFKKLDIFLQSLILRKMKKEMKEDQKDSFWFRIQNCTKDNWVPKDAVYGKVPIQFGL